MESTFSPAGIVRQMIAGNAEKSALLREGRDACAEAAQAPTQDNIRNLLLTFRRIFSRFDRDNPDTLMTIIQEDMRLQNVGTQALQDIDRWMRSSLPPT